MAVVQDPHVLRRHEFSVVAKLAIWSHPATPISLACSGFFHIFTTFASYPQGELATQCASLLTWTLLLQQEISKQCVCTVFNSHLVFVPKACTSDAAECQCVGSGSGFNSNLASIQVPGSIKDSLLSNYDVSALTIMNVFLS